MPVSFIRQNNMVNNYSVSDMSAPAPGELTVADDE